MTRISKVDEAGARKVYERAVAALDETYTLWHVEYDDGLTDDQMHQLLAGDWEDVEGRIDEWADDARWQAAFEVARSLVKDPFDWATLRQTDHSEALIEKIMDRDQSECPLIALLERTQRRLFRFSLDLDVPVTYGMEEAERQEYAELVAARLGVDLVDYSTQIQALLTEASYGGELFVIWYAQPNDVIRPILDTQWGKTKGRPASIQWESPHIVLLNRGNGSGYHEKFDGLTLTRPFDPDAFALDAKGGVGYSWDEVAGLYAPAFDCPWGMIPFDDTEEQ